MKGTKETETDSLQSVNRFSSLEGDEITLTDIWNILFYQRKLIGYFVVIAAFVSLLIAVLLPVSYRSEVVLFPPMMSDIEQLSIPGFYTIKINELYGRFLLNLQSVDLQGIFFNTHELLSDIHEENQTVKNEKKIFFKYFSEKLELKRLSMITGEKNVFSFSLEGDKPDFLAKWLNDFVSYVDIYTVQEVVGDIKTKVKSRTSMLEKKIKSLRQVAMLRRLDQVASLEEAARIAAKLNIDEQRGSIYTYKQEVKGKYEELSSIKESPSYLRGSKALLTEAEVLKNRKSDDPFIPALRNAQEKLFFLRQISPDVSSIHAVRIDQRAVVSDTPVRPKRKLIFIFGTIFGTIFGSIIALVRGGIEKTSE